jgi:hypothetical protein
MAHLLKNKEEFKKNIKVSKTSVSSLQTATTSWLNIVGSQISYTPDSGSSHVVYEFTTMVSYKDNTNNLQFQLQYGNNIGNLSDVSVNNDGYINSWGTDGGAGIVRLMEQITLSYTIPAWSGEKVLVTQTKCSSTVYETYLNGIRGPFGWVDDPDMFDSFVIIYSV